MVDECGGWKVSEEGEGERIEKRETRRKKEVCYLREG